MAAKRTSNDGFKLNQFTVKRKTGEREIYKFIGYNNEYSTIFVRSKNAHNQGIQLVDLKAGYKEQPHEIKHLNWIKDRIFSSAPIEIKPCRIITPPFKGSDIGNPGLDEYYNKEAKEWEILSGYYLCLTLSEIKIIADQFRKKQTERKKTYQSLTSYKQQIQREEFMAIDRFGENKFVGELEVEDEIQTNVLNIRDPYLKKWWLKENKLTASEHRFRIDQFTNHVVSHTNISEFDEPTARRIIRLIASLVRYEITFVNSARTWISDFGQPEYLTDSNDVSAVRELLKESPKLYTVKEAAIEVGCKDLNTVRSRLKKWGIPYNEIHKDVIHRLKQEFKISKRRKVLDKINKQRAKQ
jgi:hypothetical protein